MIVRKFHQYQQNKHLTISSCISSVLPSDSFNKLSKVNSWNTNVKILSPYCEWVSDCCLTPIQHFLAIPWREQVNFQWGDDEVHFALDQHAQLDVYSASLLKQQSAGRHVAPLGHIILIPSQPVFALSP